MTKLYVAFQGAIGVAPLVHSEEGGLAKLWIKQRLEVVFPELRGNSKALEAAYRALSLEPRMGGRGDRVFEVHAHRDPGQ